MSSYSAIVLGATGNVGGRIVQLLLQSPECKNVMVVTRRKTDAFAHPKVTELVVDMAQLEQQVLERTQGVDIAFVAFGVGKGSAKMSAAEVRQVEVLYPLAFCRAAQARGARVCALMTAAGADPNARTTYIRTMGEKETAVGALAFDFLGVFRPGVILGNTNTPSLLGSLMPLVHWALPAKYHSVHKNDLARAMVAQSEQAFEAMTQGQGTQATSKILEFEEMKAFFVDGESTEP